MNRLAGRLVKSLASRGGNFSVSFKTCGEQWIKTESSIENTIVPRTLATLHASSSSCPRAFSSVVSQRPDASEGTSSARKDARNFSWTSLALLIPPAIAALLGKWQLDRRHWKIQLLEERRNMIVDKTPIDAKDLFSTPSPSVKEYQRVTVTGRMDPSHSAFVGPRPRSQMGVTELGYLVVTPIILEHGKAVMVLRGWAPVEWVDELKSGKGSGGKADGEKVTVEGVIRYGEDPGMFVPPNSAEKGTFFYVNPGELATAAGLPESTPLIEIVSPEQDTKLVHAGGPPTAMEVLGGRGKAHVNSNSQSEVIYPLPKSVGDMLSFSVMPRDHTNYAATWFTLSGATALMATRIIQKGLRK